MLSKGLGDREKTKKHVTKYCRSIGAISTRMLLRNGARNDNNEYTFY